MITPQLPQPTGKQLTKQTCDILHSHRISKLEKGYFDATLEARLCDLVTHLDFILYPLLAFSLLIASVIKEMTMSICNKLWLSNSYNIATHSPRPFIFQTINSFRSNSLSLKYQRFTPLGCEAIGDRKFEFVAKTEFKLKCANPLFIFET